MRRTCAAILLSAVFLLTSCLDDSSMQTGLSSQELQTPETSSEIVPDLTENGDTRDKEVMTTSAETTSVEPVIREELSLEINGDVIPVTWEENESVEALKELCKSSPLTIGMSMYGGFEQVGPIGQDLPSNDEKIETASGDIVLYSGDQIVLFYGSNSWSYTRLGKMELSEEELTDLLGNGDVSIVLSLTYKCTVNHID